jgi:phosphocarrier protein
MLIFSIFFLREKYAIMSARMKTVHEKEENAMQTFQYTITDEMGLHARPAGLLVKEAKKYQSKITISDGNRKVEATKLMMLMNMGIKKDCSVTVTLEGADEETACRELEQFFKENL